MQPKPTDEDVPASVGDATPEAVTPAASVEADDTLLELLTARERGAPTRIDGVVIGVVTAVSAEGHPLVDFADNRAGAGIPARSLVALGENEVGREVALMFEGGDPTRPIAMGLMHVPEAPPEAAALAEPELERDGERLVFEAEKEIVLRCGKASITLTRAGKILIKGAYVLARSSGVNRIQGGSVQIN